MNDASNASPARDQLPSRSRVPFLLLVALLVSTVVISACTVTRTASDESETTTSPLLSDGAGFAGLVGEPQAGASSGFWEHWGDGQAEMSSYRVSLSRYGEVRDGELVLIYVTEPHDRRRWIKDDAAEAPERMEMIKLNSSLKFMTGVYPYSVMTSVFAPVEDWGAERFQPVKITHSVQEWCGNYLHQVWPGREAMRSLLVSYFPQDGESLGTEPVPGGTLYEDGLLIQLRELDGSFAEGGDWEGWLVPSLWNVRRGVAPAEPILATIEREVVPPDESADGIADEGDFGEVTRFTLSYGEYTREFDVETAEPRRIVAWRSSLGDSARLVRTVREPYWTQNGLEGDRQRVELGLSPNSSGVPPE